MRSHIDDVARSSWRFTRHGLKVTELARTCFQRTLQRVKAAVDDLGYTPNFGARFMAAKRTMTIGAIIPTMENAIFAQGIQAFQERFIALGIPC